jgi:hypothetical protein
MWRMKENGRTKEASLKLIMERVFVAQNLFRHFQKGRHGKISRIMNFQISR